MTKVTDTKMIILTVCYLIVNYNNMSMFLKLVTWSDIQSNSTKSSRKWILFNPCSINLCRRYWIWRNSDSYCSLKSLCSGMGEVVPARTSPTLLPHPLALCCHYPVSKCHSASIVVTGTVRVNQCSIHGCKLLLHHSSCRTIALGNEKPTVKWIIHTNLFIYSCSITYYWMLRNVFWSAQYIYNQKPMT